VSGAALAAPLFADPQAERPGGRLTLEQLLERVWEGLAAEGAAACAVCGGLMTRAEDGGGRCGGCGSTLA
jgi:hypothetical protein